jgi:hypothetical protein
LHHSDIRRPSEISCEALRETGVKLDRGHSTAAADEMAQDGRVIANADADMHRMLARFGGGTRDQQRVQPRLAVI